MLKYVDTLVGFSEVPDNISLLINISNCHCNCKGCHSPYLAEDTGTPLTTEELMSLIENNKGITCVAFMGGNSEPQWIDFLANYIKKNYSKIKVAWYSGRQELSKDIDLRNFDFVKLGPYIEELGPLTSKTTNQRFYKVNIEPSGDNYWESLEDITYKFQKT